MSLVVNGEILRLREVLDNLIEVNADFKEVYKISTELDSLINRFYLVKK